jgi:Flp pilus assembly pilin Flp
MYIKNKRGQSTVEYVLLVTAVLAVIIAFVSGSGNGGFQSQLNTTLNQATNEMNSEAGRLSTSHAASTSTDQGTPTGYSVNPEK